MHLKSLTLRGFKSFASATTLHFEPGITCVVGPNGSGKSNVVDALAWVMGEQGAKTLRGGSMQDVIFAGTSGRPPLGRAEVQLVIDNTDGALPVEYAEVSISRTMFRSGGSEYAINGQPCRLLDVQELLSDSGIGREMHVVVGQGRLDEVLAASPHDRLGFIEEAAGVLKHRKRKEKALRKLDATEANLTRLEDLLTEIRRQLKPLGRQAEVARRAGVVQAEARDARARLLADDLVAAGAALQADLDREAALQDARRQMAADRAASQAAAAGLEEALRGDVARLAQAHATWYELCRLRERLAGTAGLAAERLRVLAEEPGDDPAGPDPADLAAELGQVRIQEEQAAAERDRCRAALEGAAAARRAAEADQQEEDRRVGELARDAADRREEVARLTGEVHALRTRAAAAEEELERLAAAREGALARVERAQRRFTALETTVAGLDAGEHGLDAEHEAALAALSDVDDRLGKLREELQAAERERSGLAARHEALAEGLAAADGAAIILADRDQLPGVVGPLAELVSVEAGYEAAVAAALGPVGDAIVVRDVDAAVEAIRHLKERGGGRAGLLSQQPAAEQRLALPAGARPAADLLDAPHGLREVLRQLLGDTAVVEDLAAGRALVGAFPDLRAVTRDGDMVGPCFTAGGSPSRPSALAVRARVADAAAQLEEARHRCERLRFDLVRLEEERSAAARRVEVAVAKLHESDAALAAVAEELGELTALGRAAREEADRLSRAVDELSAGRQRDLARLAQAEHRLAAVHAAPVEEPDTARLEELAAAARTAREAELEARLALRTAEERARALTGRAQALSRLAREQEAAGARAAARQERRAAEAVTARAVAAAAAVVLERLERSVRDADAERQEADRARVERERRLAAVQGRVRDLDAELDLLTDEAHRQDLARAEHRMQVDALERRAMDELGLDPRSLVADFGPDRPVSSLAGDGAEPAADEGPVPFVRSEQEERLRRAERALAVLGKVNPLALEEFSALEERHRFLTEQLDDVRRTRADLLQIIRDVDDRVRQVLTEAMADTAREFAVVFSRLFPGGEGRLVLTEPDDILASGVEVEARPAGKSVKRLSLLSGGERALVAVAFLVALFKARPSPFYVLDEVEAALDDTNLGRLLDICTELRDSSQLLIVTHQKRTMEIADALYGVSMAGDGVSTVIGQRLRTAVVTDNGM